jgi:hypothetical protein
MKLYIESLICRLANSGPFLFDPQMNIWKGDQAMLASLSRNPVAGKGWTEKQRTLVLKICNRYKVQLIQVFGPAVEQAIQTPEFQFGLQAPPSYEKSITIADREILIKFPFNEEIVGKIRKFRDQATFRIEGWNENRKSWVLPLEESSILWLKNNLMPLGFSADDQFLEFSDQISEILEKIEDYIPIVVEENGKFKFRNVHHNVPQPEFLGIKETLLLARQHGISVWDENIQNLIKNEDFSPILASFLNVSDQKGLDFDASENSIDQFADLFNLNCPALIIVPPGNELNDLHVWVKWLKSMNFSEDSMSVLFRLDKENGKSFNDYVRDFSLNQPLSEKTKVVFISQKIPKPLIKFGIEFKFIVNLGSISGAHFSISNYLQDNPDVIKYQNKNKIGYQFGLL